MGLLNWISSDGKSLLAGGPAAPYPVGSGDPATTLVSFANGDSLTAAIDLVNQRLHRIVIPAAWTAAAISFDVSYDGVTYSALFNGAGEVSLASASVGANRAVVVDYATFIGIRYLKIRSGLVGAVVPQGAQRDLVLVTIPR